MVKCVCVQRLANEAPQSDGLAKKEEADEDDGGAVTEMSKQRERCKATLRREREREKERERENKRDRRRTRSRLNRKCRK
jgi:hypothetical protein